MENKLSKMKKEVETLEKLSRSIEDCAGKGHGEMLISINDLTLEAFRLAASVTGAELVRREKISASQKRVERPLKEEPAPTAYDQWKRVYQREYMAQKRSGATKEQARTAATAAAKIWTAGGRAAANSIA